ncbi:MAG: hypothetical protein AAGF85_21495 [Bacteroidota bacterium]
MNISVELQRLLENSDQLSANKIEYMGGEKWMILHSIITCEETVFSLPPVVPKLFSKLTTTFSLLLIGCPVVRNIFIHVEHYAHERTPRSYRSSGLQP